MNERQIMDNVIHRMEVMYGSDVNRLDNMFFGHERKLQEANVEMLRRAIHDREKPKPSSSLFIGCLSPFIITIGVFVLVMIFAIICCGIGALCG